MAKFTADDLDFNFGANVPTTKPKRGKRPGGLRKLRPQAMATIIGDEYAPNPTGSRGASFGSMRKR